MRIARGNGPQKCTCCLRSKEEVLQEHLRTMQNCDNPYCPFHDYINNEIRRKREKKTFTFGTPRKKATIKFGAKKSGIKIVLPFLILLASVVACSIIL